jgi:eukaryotic-like serine/threonine-protein kinase
MADFRVNTVRACSSLGFRSDPVSEPVFQFGEFELHSGRFQLFRKGRPLRVEPKPLQLLILLVSREGHLVSRREIIENLWERDVFVDTDHGINTAIRKLRHLLRDDSETPKYIETVTGKGYRFVAPVSLVVPDSPVAPVAAAAPAVAPEQTPEQTPEFRPEDASPSRPRALVWSTAVVACIAIALGSVALYRWPHRRLEVTYTQLTDFTDSAVAPTLSPDGHMLAFIRGGDPFLTADQIYVKMLPNGESRRVTDDSRPKYGLAFSPDGSEIAYTVLEAPGPAFNTYEVSVLGGEPQSLLKNAAGLVWLDPQRLLFSMIRPGDGIHLGVVTATLTRAGQRDIYFPAHERGMAHYSFPSPDRRSALVVEMNGNGDWAPCRLVSLNGQQPTKSVGPAGPCTSAGWSPDGKWMYFTAWIEGHNHIWRQRFSGGASEQITFGPAEEDGLAVEPGGRALITSVGVQQSAIWIHDGNGQRPLSSEGEVASWPTFSRDASILYYLLRRGEGPGAELWRTMVDSGKSEAVFPGISMTTFDLSPDGKQVLYAADASHETASLWVAPLDRSLPATRVSILDVQSPHFGDHGEILFQRTEGSRNYLERMNPDGSHSSKVFQFPIADFQGVSPGRHWAIVNVAGISQGNRSALMAIPLNGGVPRRICASFCIPAWSPDGKYLFVPVEDPSRTDPGRSLAIPLGPGETLPVLPADGIAPSAELDVVRGAKSVARAELTPGKDLEHYAWVNTTVHRNLYRISLP